jgi:PHP family Zn ribbon phosphoesterase
MAWIADLHIHSHFSIATSRDLVPEHLDFQARCKGIRLVGTGDATHPGWLAELEEKLEAIRSGGFPELADAIARMRARRVNVMEGFDGHYGRVTVSDSNAPPLPLLSFSPAEHQHIRTEKSFPL